MMKSALDVTNRKDEMLGKVRDLCGEQNLLVRSIATILL